MMIKYFIIFISLISLAFAEKEMAVAGRIDDFESERVARLLKEAGDEPVRVYIVSEGGYIKRGKEIYYALEETKGAHTVLVSHAASIAAIIFLATSDRAMGPEAELAFHEPYITIWMRENHGFEIKWSDVKGMHENGQLPPNSKLRSIFELYPDMREAFNAEIADGRHYERLKADVEWMVDVLASKIAMSRNQIEAYFFQPTGKFRMVRQAEALRLNIATRIATTEELS